MPLNRSSQTLDSYANNCTTVRQLTAYILKKRYVKFGIEFTF
jgi:hypothetical protein